MLDNLSPEHSQYIVAAIASGRYQSEAEALNQAVHLLQRRDELRAMLEVAEQQIDAGLGIPAEEVFDRLEQRAMELDRVTRKSAS
jgi:Arc/MetJ-type ribon-helix-helix transcriptional regulator